MVVKILDGVCSTLFLAPLLGAVRLYTRKYDLRSTVFNKEGYSCSVAVWQLLLAVLHEQSMWWAVVKVAVRPGLRENRGGF